MTADGPASPDVTGIPQDNDGEARRLHPGTLLLRAPQLVRSLFNAIPLFVLLAAKGNTTLLLLAGLGILSIGWVGILLYWMRFSYRIGTQDVAIESGILSRTHRVIPFDRVQDVSIEQGVIARALGLARVRLETGASAGAGKDEGELNAITLSEAEGLRDRIRSWRAGHRGAVIAATELDEAEEAAQDHPIFTMPLPRVLTAGLFNFSLILFAGLFGLLQAFDDILPFDPFSPRSWWRYFNPDNPYLAYLAGHKLVSIVAGLVLLGLVGMASGVVMTLLKQYGFRLERTPVGLRRQRGLLTRTDVVIPLKRILAAMIETGWLRRRLGWHALKLQSLAGDGTQENDHEVAPFAHLAEIDTILAETANPALTRSDVAAAGWHSVHPAMWRRWALLAVPLSLIAIGVALTPGVGHKHWLWALLPLFGWLMLARYGRWSHHRYRLELAGEEALRLEITHGWLRRRQIILPVRNIQSADIDYGPLYRIAGLASLRLGVAGQGRLTPYHIGALPLATAYALRARLLP